MAWRRAGNSWRSGGESVKAKMAAKICKSGNGDGMAAWRK